MLCMALVKAGWLFVVLFAMFCKIELSFSNTEYYRMACTIVKTFPRRVVRHLTGSGASAR